MSDASTVPGDRLLIINWRALDHPLAGGAEVFCDNVAREAHARGMHVTWLTARGAGSPAQEGTAYGRIVRRGGRYSVYPHALWWIARHRREYDYVLDSQNGIPFFSPLAAGRHTPIALLIHHVHQNQFAQYFPRPIALVGQVLENQVSSWIYGRRSVCAVSPSSREDVRRQLTFKGPVFVTPGGQQQPARTAAPAIRSDCPTIVCVGRLTAHKRFDLVVLALEKLEGVHLHLVGDGEERAPLNDLVNQLGLSDRVVLHGYLPEPSRNALLRSAWLTVSASSGEGWGLSIIEAAAYGVPAVAFAVSGLRDSIRDGRTGWLIQEPQALSRPVAIAKLAETIREALDRMADSHHADLTAAECRSWATGFSWGSTAQRLIRVLESERLRLRLSDQGREISDVASMIELDREHSADELRACLRLTDQVRETPERLEVLLEGADETGAEKALARLGLLDSVQAVRVARQVDLLGW